MGMPPWRSPSRMFALRRCELRARGRHCLSRCMSRSPGTLLQGIGCCRLPDPGALVVCLAPRFEPLPVAGAVAFEHRLELTPVDGPETKVAAALIPAQVRIGNRQAQEGGLRSGDIDELLPQLIVGEALDLPPHRLFGVSGLRVARAEHHERWPPPAVQGILRHLVLGARPACERQHDLETLSLVKTLLLADAYHGARIRPVRTAADRDLIHDRRAVD